MRYLVTDSWTGYDRDTNVIRSIKFKIMCFNCIHRIIIIIVEQIQIISRYLNYV